MSGSWLGLGKVLQRIDEVRCPECGSHLLFSRIYNSTVTDDPTLICSNGSHWIGELSQCKEVGDEDSVRKRRVGS